MAFFDILKNGSKNKGAAADSAHTAAEVVLKDISFPEDPSQAELMAKKMKENADALHESITNRALMYGAVIGDVVGSKYEFNNIKIKEFPLFSDGCSFTDDSIMTIAVAKALLNSMNNKERFAQCLIEEMQQLGRQYPYPQGGYGGRFGNWLQATNPEPYNSFGNGSAMRVSPCAIYAVELEEALELAEISASVTHNHPEGIKGAKAVAAAVFLAKNKKSKAEIKEYIEKNFYPLSESVDNIRQNYTFNETCQGTVPQAITAFLESESFEDAIRNAVSIGGDTDTVAAITGSVAWPFYLDIYSDEHDKYISQVKTYLPQEFIDTILLFDKKSQERMSSYLRINDSSAGAFVRGTRVGKNHSETHQEVCSRLEVQKWVMLTKIKDNTLKPDNTAEYYCIAADGTVFKRENNILYRLDLTRWIWIKDDELLKIWNGDGPIFQEFANFEDYFPIV